MSTAPSPAASRIRGNERTAILRARRWGHIHSARGWRISHRSPDTARNEDIRVPVATWPRPGEHCNLQPHHDRRLRFLFRWTLRRLDLAVELYHIREPQKDKAGDEGRDAALCWPLLATSRSNLVSLDRAASAPPARWSGSRQAIDSREDHSVEQSKGRKRPALAKAGDRSHAVAGHPVCCAWWRRAHRV